MSRLMLGSTGVLFGGFGGSGLEDFLEIEEIDTCIIRMY